MPKDTWLRQKFVYYYFSEKGIPPREVDEMYQEDIDAILLINQFMIEKHEMERKKHAARN